MPDLPVKITSKPSPLVIAHRGGAGLRPESTLAAVDHACDLGADGVEVDVHLSADGQVIVHHDYRLRPAATRRQGQWIDKPGPLVKDLTYDELRTYDVGAVDPASPLARTLPELIPCEGERIPLLTDVIDRIRAAGDMCLLVEMKSEPAAGPAATPPHVLAEHVGQVLRQQDFVDQTIVVGFDWRGLDRLGQLVPDVRRGFLTYPQYVLEDAPPPSGENKAWWVEGKILREMAKDGPSWYGAYQPSAYGGSLIRAIVAAGGAIWEPYFGDATAQTVAQAHEAGLGVSVWTANDDAAFAPLVQAGVDFITTDYPDRLLRFLGRSRQE